MSNLDGRQPDTSNPSFGANPSLRIAVLIPCLNEERTIGQVVRDFHSSLPGAVVYVYDNKSTDRTMEAATEAGAIVRSETRQGKGFVVRRMFADIDADVYIMVDGDGTYDAFAAPELVRALTDSGLDMVNASRGAGEVGAYRRGHKMGNWALTYAVRRLFGDEFRDLLSGYRVFSRRFVKSFPGSSRGFELETELTVHALELEMPVAEINTRYISRPEGSTSKLRTISDGLRISWMILVLLKRERPLQLFGAIGLACLLAAAVLFAPILETYYRTGLVPRFPTAILVTGIVIVAVVCVVCGIILDTVTHGRREAKRMRYLSYDSASDGRRCPPPGGTVSPRQRDCNARREPQRALSRRAWRGHAWRRYSPAKSPAARTKSVGRTFDAPTSRQV